jgi:hypothetical protein
MRILEPHMSLSSVVRVRLTGHTKQDRRQQSAEPSAVVLIYRQFIYSCMSALLHSPFLVTRLLLLPVYSFMAGTGTTVRYLNLSQILIQVLVLKALKSLVGHFRETRCVKNFTIYRHCDVQFKALSYLA